MPSHQERVKKAELPAGYQFGDGKSSQSSFDSPADKLMATALCLETERQIIATRGMFSGRPAARGQALKRNTNNWNVIEGDHH